MHAQEPISSPRVSTTLLIPVYNEQESLCVLCERSSRVLQRMGPDWEILFVDDGSDDGSRERIRAFHEEDGRIRALFLRRNFGQHAALSAGLEYARGETIVLMDGDLQFDPEDIPKLIEKLAEGYDLVGGWRVNRQDPSLRRRAPSVLVNAVIGWATGVRLHDYNCGFKAFSRRVALRVNRQGDLRRYLAPLLAMLSPRVTEIPVAHHPRRLGTSKYTLPRSLRLLWDFWVAAAGDSFAELSLRRGITWKAFRVPLRAVSPCLEAESRAPLFEIQEFLPPAG